MNLRAINAAQNILEVSGRGVVYSLHGGPTRYEWIMVDNVASVHADELRRRNCRSPWIYTRLMTTKFTLYAMIDSIMNAFDSCAHRDNADPTIPSSNIPRIPTYLVTKFYFLPTFRFDPSSSSSPPMLVCKWWFLNIIDFRFRARGILYKLWDAARCYLYR